MTEILFYQLHQPLERALPLLLEKTMQRGWRAVVRVGSEERLAVLDETLWTYKDDGFLPHGMSGDADGDMQPVYLTAARRYAQRRRRAVPCRGCGLG